MAEARERVERRKKADEDRRNQQKEWWALQQSHWEQEELQRAHELSRRLAWESEQDRPRVEREVLEDRRWMTTAVLHELVLNNAKDLQDQERHQRDYLASLPYQEHTPWTRYEDLLVPCGPSDPSPHWPEGVGSSFILAHLQPPAEGERGPLDDYHNMMTALTGYPYHPYRLWTRTRDINGDGEVCFMLLFYNFCYFILFLVFLFSS
ncbi:hypothetical protein HanXRQr2_Chr16g0749101 [Helianthus annuus]|uniref:Uncharacterized protein n=1 Tax=Helianthus annuus TaxID=4232 RepID=A0A9K3DT81_HELAN|nr:hypothetical protein HanXRQr2_Chr16g0749101 [Helianthus annuus]KAJ0460510.1 hypothetical protein HanHA89_Chr16g0661631 [Helianthus annuus]